MGLADEGSIRGHGIGLDLDSDWATNDKRYAIHPVRGPQGISLAVVINADKTVAVTVAGPFRQSFTFDGLPLPPCDERGMVVAASWENRKVQLYLNGALVDSADA